MRSELISVPCKQSCDERNGNKPALSWLSWRSGAGAGSLAAGVVIWHPAVSVCDEGEP
jgi:hypothetical protein